MKDNVIYLITALECVDLIHEYIQGYCLEDFLIDRKTQDAVIRNLEIIGQTLKDYGLDELTKKDTNIPWHNVAGMCNVLAHEYLEVDHVLIWETVEKQLGALRCALENIVNKY